MPVGYQPLPSRRGRGALIGEFWRNPLVRNAASLYLVKLSNIALPLITVPYIARVLGPGRLGFVVFAQSFGIALASFVEYGFDLSATREVARLRSDRSELIHIVAGVNGARILLVIVAGALTLCATAFIPVFAEQPHFAVLAFLCATGDGLNTRWYFTGTERLFRPGLASAGTQGMATAGVFLFVDSPTDDWKVLAFRAAATLSCSAMILFWTYREVPFRWPRWGHALWALRMGRAVLFLRAVTVLSSRANAFLLGLLATPLAVGYYGGAEKLAFAAFCMLGPVGGAVFPRVSNLAAADRREAAPLARKAFLSLLALGALLGGTLSLLAASIVGAVLGPGYEPAVAVLRVLGLWVLLMAVSNALGIQWMLPIGQTRAVASALLGGILVHVALAVLLVPTLGAVGMAWAVVLSSAFSIAVMWYSLARSGKGFWSTTKNKL